MPRLPRRPRRRSLYATGAAIIVIAAIVAVALLAGGTGKPSATPAVTTHYATVARTNLTATQSFDGTIASQDGPQIVNRQNGTITALTAEGTKVSRGQTLYSVNGQNVVLMYGALPAWRDIGGPRITDGADVQQLEQNLSAMGYDPGTIDQTFTSTTANAIELWQTAAGLTSDGIVHLGQVVFAPGPITINQQSTTVGSPVHDGQAVMTTLSSNKIVNVSLDSSNSNALSGGDAVVIDGVGNSEIPATVSTVTQPSGQGNGGGSSTAVIVPKTASALANQKDGTSVTVNLVTETHKNVLAVPVTALIARSSGGYAVQVVRGGSTTYVNVTPGLYANDLVEVSGDLQEGDKVVVP